MQAVQPADARRLVIIQLGGGNDGLNTFVPYEDDRYYAARPRLAIPKQDILKLTDTQGLHPALAPLQRWYTDGTMTLLNSVGYPNPNRSHFRSMDIWQTASSSTEYKQTGWLGRYLDAACQHSHEVIEVGNGLELALKGDSRSGLALQDPQQLQRATADPYFAQALAQQRAAEAGSPQQFLYKTLSDTRQSANYLAQQAKRVPRSKGDFPKTPLGRQLQLIARLLAAGADTKVYYTAHTGFDTHARQHNAHQRLLGQYAEAVDAFLQELKAIGWLDRTLVLTFSEFGRRVAQNASLGTDHGTANNLWLFGGKLKRPGVFNAPPDLADLDAGDLKYQLDFRSIYATLLADWLRTDAEAILGEPFARLDLV